MITALATLNKQPIQLTETQAAVIAEMQRDNECRAYQFMPPELNYPVAA